MKLLRFNKTERLFHWAFAVPTLLLAASGIMMVFPSIGKLVSLPKDALLLFHTRTGFILMIVPVLVYLMGDRKAVNRNIKDFLNFSASDRCWLVMNFISLVKAEIELPLEGKFNGGQKVNALLMMSITLILCTSGLTMLAVKGALVANIFHAFSFTLFIMLFSGHFYLATINPATRPAFMGIINGYVEADWLQHHHYLMFQKLQNSIFGDVVVDHAKKNELKTIYDKVYKDKISSTVFTQLCHRSEAMLVARKNDRPIAFMQVVGDGHIHGIIAELSIFAAEKFHDDFKQKFIVAAESIIEHPLLSPQTCNKTIT